MGVLWIFKHLPHDRKFVAGDKEEVGAAVLQLVGRLVGAIGGLVGREGQTEVGEGQVEDEEGQTVFGKEKRQI